MSAVGSVGSGSGGLHAFGIVVDETSRDKWVVADWRRVLNYASDSKSSLPVIVPIAGAIHSRNNTYFKTDMAIMNIGTAVASGTLRYYNQRGQTTEKPLNINVLETKLYSDVTTSLFGISSDNIGYMTFTPAAGSRVLISSRAYNGGFATDVPTQLLRETLGNGDRPARIAGVEESTLEKVAAQQAGSFRSNFGVIETTGKPATVRVTAYYRSNLDKTSTNLSASATYNLAPNQMLTGPIASLLGGDRASVGDLHAMTIEFLVVGGTGSVFPFITTVDNASGDSTVRLP